MKIFKMLLTICIFIGGMYIGNQFLEKGTVQTKIKEVYEVAKEKISSLLDGVKKEPGSPEEQENVEQTVANYVISFDISK